jgi:hypothetical protein
MAKFLVTLTVEVKAADSKSAQEKVPEAAPSVTIEKTQLAQEEQQTIILEPVVRQGPGRAEPVAIKNLVADGINWALLRKQKYWLAQQPHCEEAEGLLSLLDAIQDEAVEVHGISEETVFGPLTGWDHD